MEIKEGTTFKYLGAEFKIGNIFPEWGAGVLYLTGPNEEIYQVQLITARKMVNDGLWKRRVTKTEDGVRIYDGDTFWQLKGQIITSCKAIYGMPFNPPPHHSRLFSSQKAAELALLKSLGIENCRCGLPDSVNPGMTVEVCRKCDREIPNDAPWMHR